MNWNNKNKHETEINEILRKLIFIAGPFKIFLFLIEWDVQGDSQSTGMFRCEGSLFEIHCCIAAKKFQKSTVAGNRRCM